MLKAIVISLLLIISTGKLSCKTVLCLQENFQGHAASGESLECATVVYNLFVGLVEGKYTFFNFVDLYLEPGELCFELRLSRQSVKLSVF